MLPAMRLYDFLPSGNGYKVRLALRWLGIPFEYQEVDIFDLPRYEALRAWFSRVREQRGHLPIDVRPGRESS